MLLEVLEVAAAVVVVGEVEVEEESGSVKEAMFSRVDWCRSRDVNVYASRSVFRSSAERDATAVMLRAWGVRVY